MVVGKLLERDAEPNYGYNAANNTYEDLVKAGIIDPLKVCCCTPNLLLASHNQQLRHSSHTVLLRNVVESCCIADRSHEASA